MSLKRDIRSVGDLTTRTADLIEQVNEERRPIVITDNGEACAVLLAPESYDQMRTAIGLLKMISHSEATIEAGHVEDQDALFIRLSAATVKQPVGRSKKL